IADAALRVGEEQPRELVAGQHRHLGVGDRPGGAAAREVVDQPRLAEHLAGADGPDGAWGGRVAAEDFDAAALQQESVLAGLPLLEHQLSGPERALWHGPPFGSTPRGEGWEASLAGE